MIKKTPRNAQPYIHFGSEDDGKRHFLLSGALENSLGVIRTFVINQTDISKSLITLFFSCRGSKKAKAL